MTNNGLVFLDAYLKEKIKQAAMSRESIGLTAAEVYKIYLVLLQAKLIEL
jgi:hypothetical protein